MASLGICGGTRPDLAVHSFVNAVGRAYSAASWLALDFGDVCC